MDFDTAFTRLMGNEGRYTVDNGGPTCWGVSKRSYPMENITPDYPQERARYLFRRDFWGPAGCDSVPDVVKFELFDMAINTSAPGHPVTAIKALQAAAGITGAAVDGIIGSHTLMAINAMQPWRLLVRFVGQRIAYYTHVRPELWTEDGKGWMNRVSNNCLAM